MIDPAAQTLLARLERALDAPALPEPARNEGRDLLRRLGAPARIAVAGPRASGKSALVQLLRTNLARFAETADSASEGPAPPGALIVEAALPPGGVEAGLAALGGIGPDIVLWCSQDFAGDEAAFWAHMPETLKDRSFLVLTKADALQRRGILHDRTGLLGEIVATEFHSLIPLATAQALAAASDATALRASGAMALFDMLREAIEADRRDACAAAEMFLARSAPRPAAVEDAPAALADAEIPPETDPAAAAPCQTDPDREVTERAVALLRERIGTLPDSVTGDDPAELAALLDICSRTTEALTEIATDAGDISKDLYEDIVEAWGMTVLLTLEEDEAAAADAVTLLLQLRRGFETRLAA